MRALKVCIKGSVNVKWKGIKDGLESSYGRERGSVKECEELGT